MDNSKLDKFNKLKKAYEDLSYFDQYGGSVILLVIITIILFIFISYCHIKINAQPIIDDWPNQRCKPNILPFAGFITHPTGISAIDYTAQNFNYCTQNILSSITGYAVEPITFTVGLLNNLLEEIKSAVNNIRAMFDKVRTFFQTFAQEIMGRLMNVMVPLQQIIISFKDMIAKIQGAMTSGLFTLLGSYYTLKSLLGAIAQFIITILIALAALIFVFWIFPFTWGLAISNTVIFIAISIPLAIMLVFMSDVLKVHSGLSIPGLKKPSMKCFDENTIISLDNGEKKPICEIKVGDILCDNNKVTATFKVYADGSKMYNLNGVIVSDTHLVRYKDKWIRVCNHPDAVKLANYEKPFLYCLNTSMKHIYINDINFSDWDEVFNNNISEISKKSKIKISNLNDIHKKIDGGFSETTKIKMYDGTVKEIKNISINDKLANEEKVYGIVEINGTDIEEQFTYNLGSFYIEGGPNIAIFDKKIGYNTTLDFDFINKVKIEKKHQTLYHLLTNTGNFKIGNIRFKDYNSIIDTFLEK
jgi:hypothetical protein